MMRQLLPLLAFALAASCAKPSGSSESEPLPSINSPVITAEELANSGMLGGTAYEAVRRLRPGFLVDRTAGPRRTTQPIQVSVNGGQLAPISSLNGIPASTVSEIRYLTLGQATQRIRTRVDGPVILVTMSTRPAPDK